MRLFRPTNWNLLKAKKSFQTALNISFLYVLKTYANISIQRLERQARQKLQHFLSWVSVNQPTNPQRTTDRQVDRQSDRPSLFLQYLTSRKSTATTLTATKNVSTEKSFLSIWWLHNMYISIYNIMYTIVFRSEWHSSWLINVTWLTFIYCRPKVHVRVLVYIYLIHSTLYTVLCYKAHCLVAAMFVQEDKIQIKKHICTSEG